MKHNKFIGAPMGVAPGDAACMSPRALMHASRTARQEIREAIAEMNHIADETARRVQGRGAGGAPAGKMRAIDQLANIARRALVGS